MKSRIKYILNTEASQQNHPLYFKKTVTEHICSTILLTHPETSVSLHPKMATESKDYSGHLKYLPLRSRALHDTSTFAGDIQGGFCFKSWKLCILDYNWNSRFSTTFFHIFLRQGMMIPKVATQWEKIVKTEPSLKASSCCYSPQQPNTVLIWTRAQSNLNKKIRKQ